MSLNLNHKLVRNMHSDEGKVDMTGTVEDPYVASASFHVSPILNSTRPNSLSMNDSTHFTLHSHSLGIIYSAS